MGPTSLSVHWSVLVCYRITQKISWLLSKKGTFTCSLHLTSPFPPLGRKGLYHDPQSQRGSDHGHKPQHCHQDGKAEAMWLRVLLTPGLFSPSLGLVIYGAPALAPSTVVWLCQERKTLRTVTIFSSSVNHRKHNALYCVRAKQMTALTEMFFTILRHSFFPLWILTTIT